MNAMLAAILSERATHVDRHLKEERLRFVFVHCYRLLSERGNESESRQKKLTPALAIQRGREKKRVGESVCGWGVNWQWMVVAILEGKGRSQLDGQLTILSGSLLNWSQCHFGVLDIICLKCVQHCKLLLIDDNNSNNNSM